MADKLLGAILPGGQSHRFGSDKAVAVWHGSSPIGHAAAAHASVADDIVICRRAVGPSQAIADLPKRGRGALAELNAAPHWRAEHGHGHVLSIGCDTPGAPEGLHEQLIARNGPACALDCKIIGCWPTAFAANLDHSFATDPNCSLKGWASCVGGRVPCSAPILNINVPADLAAAE